MGSGPDQGAEHSTLYFYSISGKVSTRGPTNVHISGILTGILSPSRFASNTPPPSSSILPHSPVLQLISPLYYPSEWMKPLRGEFHHPPLQLPLIRVLVLWIQRLQERDYMKKHTIWANSEHNRTWWIFITRLIDNRMFLLKAQILMNYYSMSYLYLIKVQILNSYVLDFSDESTNIEYLYTQFLIFISLKYKSC